MNNRISQKFAELKKQKRIAFMPFVVAGDPDYKVSLKLLKLVAVKADFLEIGFPYSDPLADGPTIQKADNRALESGVNTDQVFELIKKLRKSAQIPITVLVYTNLVYQRGIDRFYKDAFTAGIDGVLIPDLPVEEIEDFYHAARKFSVQQIFLVSQTTTKKRLEKILEYAEGYLYLVSILGITGARSGLARETLSLIRRVKKQTKLPVVVGFGISKPEQIKTLRKSGADGAIVGSALVNFIDQNLKKSGFEIKLDRFLKSFRV
jgi:tryptophan synthase alpha chain